MLRSSLAAAFAAALATGYRASPPLAQDDAEQRLGTVHFETSCNETAQRRFDRGMRYQHSFWYRAVQGDFRGCRSRPIPTAPSRIGASR